MIYVKSRRVNVDRMRSYSAKTTPDSVKLRVSRRDLEIMDNAPAVHVLEYWLKLMRIKHANTLATIDVELDDSWWIISNEVTISGRVRFV